MQRGFTLIELLIVITIIGILSSVVLVSLSSAREKSRDAARVSQIKEVKTALEVYRSDNGGYINICSGSPGNLPARAAALAPNYMSRLPTDPLHTGNDDYLYCGSANVNGSGPGYGIRIRFEDTDRPGTNANGYCKTGVNISTGWWGTGVPVCEGL
ncbi:prepilin-type N-terminal cleavage/methylation domain-containing protein [Candidatus Kaiserbacteria bacterium]|nr:prepilin-type N-terminal cleavage/methylation domain-containing protein [Candidatus Kaiserbacteria bacterium]